MIVLHWIKHICKEWKVCVQNRVNKISEVLKPECLHYVSSVDNPAEVTTRDCLPIYLVDNIL